MKLFATERALTPSWQLVKPSMNLVRDHLWAVAYLSFFPALLMTVGLVMVIDGDTFATGTRLNQGTAIIAIAGLWGLLTEPGFTLFQAKAVQGQILTTGEAFAAGLKRLAPLVLNSILIFILVLAGLLFFIIPGLILLRAFYLSSYYVVEKNMGPVAALKESYRDSQPVAGWIWGIIGVSFAIAMVAGTIGRIPVAGYILALVINYLYIFAPAMRYAEIAHRKKLSVDTE